MQIPSLIMYQFIVSRMKGGSFVGRAICALPEIKRLPKQILKFRILLEK